MRTVTHADFFLLLFVLYKFPLAIEAKPLDSYFNPRSEADMIMVVENTGPAQQIAKIFKTMPGFEDIKVLIISVSELFISRDDKNEEDIDDNAIIALLYAHKASTAAQHSPTQNALFPNSFRLMKGEEEKTRSSFKNKVN